MLLAEHGVLRLVPDALRCEGAALEQAALPKDVGRALGCCCGEPLPGFYGDWVREERLRPAGLAEALTLAAIAQLPQLASAPAPATAAPLADRLPSYGVRAFGLLPTPARLRQHFETA